MPYSIERECTQIRLTPPHRKQDRVFILAKLAEYFYQRDTAPNATVFADFKEQTGLGLVSVAKDRKTKDGWVGAGVPEGVEEWDQLSREDFEFAIGQSKVSQIWNGSADVSVDAKARVVGDARHRPPVHLAIGLHSTVSLLG